MLSPSSEALLSRSPPILPTEIWDLIIRHYTPTREQYAVTLPWKQIAPNSTLASLSQVCRQTRSIAIPLIWSIVYVETMKDWGLLWKRISKESGRHIKVFLSFWSIAHLPHLSQDNLEKEGKDLLWLAFQDRRCTMQCDCKYCLDPECFPSPSNYYGIGPDGYGPDAIIDSRETFLKACQDVSSTWSKRLSTLYWDASTCFPECVILNIRNTQEGSSLENEGHLVGLENLCIDFKEACSHNKISCELSRRETYFHEPIWKLGEKTLGKLKFFALSPPFWPNSYEYFVKGVYFSGTRTPNSQLPPLRSISTFAEETGAGIYYKTLLSIRPEIFHCSSQAPFHCKILLPCWARLRRINHDALVIVTNEPSVSKKLDAHSHHARQDFYETKCYYKEYKLLDVRPPPGEVFMTVQEAKRAVEYVRAAIHLRPALHNLYLAKGCRHLTGVDVQELAKRGARHYQLKPIQWSEDWRNSQARIHLHESKLDDEVRQVDDLFGVYREWLREDSRLAEQVAESFNGGIKEDEDQVSYPFCHSDYAGKVYFETESCQSEEEKDNVVWLDRPPFRGSYSNISKKNFPWPHGPDGREFVSTWAEKMPFYNMSL